ncbi:MAG: hypothetical protein KatS3mg102_1139 [Planctomycetota bacterium]|nr:MAG: hypothetical protein KatS3mg102_1139 [Planctomycetota bacterium]
MLKEGLEFWPALVLLAERAGLPVPRGARAAGSGSTERQRLLELNRWAAAFFRRALLASREGERARAYLEQRGIGAVAAERFGLGYAPQGGRHLVRALQRRGVAMEQAAAAGLVVARQRGGGWRDRFRGRLMFPIQDALGRTIGFGGRTLEPGGVPKYLNSPESAIFRKREIVYGLHLAKEAIQRGGRVGVVEGYTDVILAHQAGYPWLVATLGTAFGAEHARLLRRYAERLVVFFDGDEAGAQANVRSLEEVARAVFQGAQPFVELRVASLPPGLDPADLVQQRGAAALGEVLERAAPLIELLVPAAARTWAVGERRRAAERAARVLGALEDKLERELQLREVAHRLELPEELVRELAAAARAGEHRRAAPAASGDQAQPAATPAALERRFLRCLLARPQLAAQAQAVLAEPELVCHPAVRRAAEALVRGESVAEIEDAAARALAVREAAHLDPELEDERTWRGVLARLAAERERRRAAQLGLERPGSDEALRAFQESQRLIKARHLET